MFSNDRYKKLIIPPCDFYEGILSILYLILNIIMIIIIILLFNNITSHIKIITIIIICVESIINIIKILIWIFFNGSNDDYNNYKIILLLPPCIISLPISGFIIYILIVQIDENIFVLCGLLSYLIISCCRIFNTYSCFLS
jgi:hypothetical protein